MKQSYIYFSYKTARHKEASRVRSRMFTKAGCILSAQLTPRGAQTWSEGE